MGILENIADIMQAQKQSRGDSVEHFSEQLEISPSTAQDYLKARGNPTVKTIEHLAEKLGLDPIVLVSGSMEPGQYEVALLMLDMIQEVSELPQPKRLRFAELFLEQVQLWEEDK